MSAERKMTFVRRAAVAIGLRYAPGEGPLPGGPRLSRYGFYTNTRLDQDVDELVRRIEDLEAQLAAQLAAERRVERRRGLRSALLDRRAGRREARQLLAGAGATTDVGGLRIVRPIADLELTRVPGDRRLYELRGVGTLRLEASFSRSAAAEAGDQRWQITRRHPRRFWPPRIVRRGELIIVFQATDPSGVVAGEFHGHARVRDGKVRWGERDLELRPSRRRFVLVDGALELELATIKGKGWGKRPVKLTTYDEAAVEPGLLLLAAFVVGALTEDAMKRAAQAATLAPQFGWAPDLGQAGVTIT